jgi:hypothetical protein
MKTNRFTLGFLALALALVGFTSCGDEPTDPVDWQSIDGGSTPTISAITPSLGLVGISEFTISGANFNADSAGTWAWIDGRNHGLGVQAAKIVSASATELVIQVPYTDPPLVGDSILVRVMTADAADFAEEHVIALEEPMFEFGGLSLEGEIVKSMTMDDGGNIYAAITSKINNAAVGITKIAPNEDREMVWSPPEFDLTLPNGNTVTLPNSPNTMAPAGADKLINDYKKQSIVMSVPDTAQLLLQTGVGKDVVSMDFDDQGRLWTGGGSDIHRVDFAADTVQAFTDMSPSGVNDIAGVRFYDGKLYAVVADGDGAKVFAMPVDGSGNLGAATEYFSSAEVEDPNCITFSADGELFIGYKEGVYRVHTDKSAEKLYPGVVEFEARQFEWHDTFLYIAYTDDDGVQAIKKVQMLEAGAPRYGF